jgi:hypothetical protein
VAALIGEQRVGDAALVSEGGQHLHTVVADREDCHSVLLELRPGFLQLHELHFAVGSPAGTAVEHDKRSAISTLSVQIHQTPVLVR